MAALVLALAALVAPVLVSATAAGAATGPPAASQPSQSGKPQGGKPQGGSQSRGSTPQAGKPQGGSQQAGTQHASRGRATRPTVVSLTFDDGDADQLVAAHILQAHRLRGTFYIITGAVGTPGYLTRAQLHQVTAAGHEIGGHTVSHLDLNRVSPAEARRQVCGGRDILARWGFRTTSFAYPGGFYSPALQAAVRACGFSSARIVGGLRVPGCAGCARAESLPPARPYAIRTPGQLDGHQTLARLQQLVRSVQGHGGGWLPLVFHHICTTAHCGPLSVRSSLLGQFAGWLTQQRPAGVEVRTVGAVAGGQPRPLVRVPPAAAHGVVNPSLETGGITAGVDPALEVPGVPGSFVRCWMPGGFGQNTARWTRVHDARTGRWALRLVVSRYRSGDIKLLQQFDLGGCSLPVRAGKSYQLSSWYQATARSQYSVFYRDSGGRWVYWTSSPYFTPSSRWAQAGWRTPPLPAGATGLSFGLTVSSKGTLTTDSYRFTVAPPSAAQTLMRWVLLAEGLAGFAAISWGVAHVIRRRRRGPGEPRPSAGPAQPAAYAWSGGAELVGETLPADAEVAGETQPAGQAPRLPDPPTSSSSSR
jgi:peptidoglycan/xylan/chitin deacetylase (PgdA/CDA1 family)